MAYDPNLGAAVLFGGVSIPGGQANDSWLWNGSDWKQMHPATAPTARFAAGMDYSPIANGLLLFGGFGTATVGDTWILTRPRHADEGVGRGPGGPPHN